MNSIFQDFLIELGKELDIPINIDNPKAITFLVDDILNIQIENNPIDGNIIIAAFVTRLTPGKFRENVLRETLKYNDIFERIGTFGYSDKENDLVLFDFLPFPEIKMDVFINYISSFIETSFKWKESIERGNAAPDDFLIAAAKPSKLSPLDLKP
jgi:hypothetical protein